MYFDTNKYRRGQTEIRYETAYDDTSSYYRKACRENPFCLSDWNKITNYKIDRSGKISKADYVIHCDYKDIEWDDIDKTDEANKQFANDRTLVMGWDLETHTYDPAGDVPLPERDTDEIFMAGITFSWRNEKKPFLRVGVVTRPCDLSETTDVLIQVETEKDLLKSISKIIQSMMPDFIVDFNGGQYDWPWVLHRAKKHNILLTMAKQMTIMKEKNMSIDNVTKWCLKTNDIKIEADKKHRVSYLRLPGYECIDVRPQFRRLPKFKTSEQSSLNYFLAQCGLESKLDMPYTRLRDIFRNSDNLDEEMTEQRYRIWNKLPKGTKVSDEDKARFRKEAPRDMAEAMNYCMIDAQRCQELLLSKSVIGDVREVCNRSFTSMYDGLYLADGMKVRNLMFHWTMKYGLEPSTIAHPEPKFKFPGAYVVDPEIGLENKRPVTGLDFSSLYPSLIRAYNLSPEYAVFGKEEADRLKAEGHNLHYIEFDYPTGKIKGWTVRHDNKPDKTGIYPFILGMLFDQRKILKKTKLVPLGERLEELDKEGHGNSEEYSDTKLKYDYIDSKQKALKVFMNTFYGLMGDTNSSLFILMLAGAVTSAGQYNIKMVHKYVTGRGYKVKYGDTDSLYIIPPDSVYAKADKDYKKGKLTKLEYWSEMVSLTMKDLATFKDEVNNMLEQDNGSPHLKMAYEEVLFPVAFLAKKIYYGIPHENIVNFSPKKLFIRGLAVIKRGVPEFIKTLDHEVMWESMSVENTKTIRNLVEDKIISINKREWTLDDFAESAEYRPKKDQKSIKLFVQRLSKKEQPEPGVRFKYIVAEKYPFKYSVDGKMERLKKGDKMEYLEVAKEKSLKVDMEHYLMGRVVGQFSRFVAADPQFHADTLEKRKKKAEAHIKILCKQHITQFKNKGSLYRDLFKQSRSVIDEQYTDMYGDSADILRCVKTNPRDDIMKNITTRSNATARRKVYKEELQRITARLLRGRDPFRLWQLYYSSHDSIYRARKKFIRTQLASAERQLDGVLPKLDELMKESSRVTEQVVEKLKKELGLDTIGMDADSKIPKLEEIVNMEKLQKKVMSKIKKLQLDDKNNKLLAELNAITQRIYDLKMYDKHTEDLIKNLSYAKSVKAGNVIDAPTNIAPVQQDELLSAIKGIDLRY